MFVLLLLLFKQHHLEIVIVSHTLMALNSEVDQRKARFAPTEFVY